jgi:hypothetical protein
MVAVRHKSKEPDLFSPPEFDDPRRIDAEGHYLKNEPAEKGPALIM